MKITGDRRHRQRIQRLKGQALVSELGKRVKAAGFQLEGEAAYLITKGSIQGKGHIPSKPGEPPNKDTGFLIERTKYRPTGVLSGVVESDAPYSVVLEFGGSKVEERPFMRPAAATVREHYAINIKTGVNKVIRRS